MEAAVGVSSQSLAFLGAVVKNVASVEEISFPHIPKWTPSQTMWFVEIFASSAPDFPHPHESDEEYQKFLVNCMTGPAIVMLLGIVGATIALCCSCACPCISFNQRELQYARRATSKPSFLLSLLTFALLGAGGVAFWKTGVAAQNMALDAVASVGKDVNTTATLASTLLASGKNVEVTLPKLPGTCKDAAARNQVNGFVGKAVQPIGDFVKAVADFEANVRPLRQDVQDVHTSLRTYSKPAMIALLVPFAMVLVCLVVVFLVVCCARTSGFGLRWCLCLLGPLVCMPTIFVVAASAAAEIGGGIVISSFCKNADANALTWFTYAARDVHVGNVPIINQTEYYVYNGTRGSDWFQAQLDMVQDNLTQVNDQVFPLLEFLNTTATCNITADERDTLSDSVDNFKSSIQTARSLLSASHIYHYYDTTVHTEICSTFVTGAGWLGFAETLVGLICLPLLILVTSRYLRKHALWETAADEAARQNAVYGHAMPYATQLAFNMR